MHLRLQPMNSRRALLIALTAGIAVLFVLSIRSMDSPVQQHPGPITSGALLSSPEIRNSAPDSATSHTLTPEELRARAFSVLSLPRQSDRLREFCELLRFVTTENAGIVREAKELLRRREGRDAHAAELLLKNHLERLASGSNELTLPPKTGDIGTDLAALGAISGEVQKMRRFLSLLRDVTVENWQEAIATLEPPDGPHKPLIEARRAMLRAQIGAIAGRFAVEQALRTKGMSEASDFAAAWSANAPAAAVAWLDTLTNERHKEGATFWVAYGIGHLDPHRAWNLAIQLPVESRSASTEMLVYHIADHSGMRPAEAFYNVLRKDPRVSEQTLQKAFYRLAVARELMLFRGTSEDASAALSWLDAYLPAGVKPSATFIGAAGRLAPDQTLHWLDMRRDRMTEESAAPLYQSVAKAWHANSPEAFAAWLQSHSDHPQRAAMSSATAKR